MEWNRFNGVCKRFGWQKDKGHMFWFAEKEKCIHQFIGIVQCIECPHSNTFPFRIPSHKFTTWILAILYFLISFLCYQHFCATWEFHVLVLFSNIVLLHWLGIHTNVSIKNKSKLNKNKNSLRNVLRRHINENVEKCKTKAHRRYESGIANEYVCDRTWINVHQGSGSTSNGATNLERNVNQEYKAWLCHPYSFHSIKSLSIENGIFRGPLSPFSFQKKDKSP